MAAMIWSSPAFLGVFEPAFDDHVVAGAVHRLGQVGQDLCPREGANIAFPAIDEAGQGRGRVDRADGLQKTGILGAEILFGQEHRSGPLGWRLGHSTPSQCSAGQRPILHPRRKAVKQVKGRVVAQFARKFSGVKGKLANAINRQTFREG